MNITLIVKEFPKASETFILDQVRGLLDRGHKVRVLSMRNPRERDIPGDHDLDGITTSLGWKGGFGGGKLWRTVKICAQHAADVRFLCMLAARPTVLEIVTYPVVHSPLIAEADVVVVHYGDLGAHWAFLDTLPFVVVFHGVDVARHLPALPEKERSRLWKAMTRGLPVSRFWKNRLVELGCPPGKLKVHHMGIDTERFRPAETTVRESGGFRMVSVCRLVDKKGIDTALEAVARIIREYPARPVTYDIVGNGPERSRLEQLAASLGIGGAVTFHGERPREYIRDLFAEADAFVLPSRTASNGDMEGIPVSLMEAMASGLAVVSTHHSGIPELVEDGVSGLLAGENDIEGIARALKSLIDDPVLVSRLGKNARATVVADFNQTRLHDELTAALLQTCESGERND